MKYFAKLDADNKVVNTVVFNDDATEDSVASFYNDGSTYKEYKEDDTSFRKNPAIINGYYHPEADAFATVKPFESWVLNTDDYHYYAPVTQPANNDQTHFLSWDEVNQRWFRDELTADGFNKDPRVIEYWNPETQTWGAE